MQVKVILMYLAHILLSAPWLILMLCSIPLQWTTTFFLLLMITCFVIDKYPSHQPSGIGLSNHGHDYTKSKPKGPFGSLQRLQVTWFKHKLGFMHMDILGSVTDGTLSNR